MLLIDTYSPKSKEDIYFHKEIYDLLAVLRKDNSFPNLIFHGPAGVGKKVIIRIFLEKLFNKNINKLSDIQYNIDGCGNKETKVFIKQSDYHIVIEPNNNNFDKYLVQNIIKEYAEKDTMFVKSKRNLKVILINNIDNMSYSAQASLRRTMEKYSSKCKFILWCHSLSKVTEPLISRCMCIRVSSPTNLELFKYINIVALKEKITLTLSKYTKIINLCDGNIKELLWHLEYIKAGNYDKDIEYEKYIEVLINYLLLADITKIEEIRIILYNMMITNFSTTKIVIDLIVKICMSKKISENIKYKLIQHAAFLDYELIRSRREIVQFDKFIVNCIKDIYSSK